MREHKENIIEENIIADFNQLHKLALTAINQYLAISTLTKIGISMKVFLGGGCLESFYHGAAGKSRAEKLKTYLERVSVTDHAALLVLCLAVFSAPGTKGQSTKLVSLIAEQWISGRADYISPFVHGEYTSSLASEVFSPQSISDVTEDKENFTTVHGDENSFTIFNKSTGARALLLQAINQIEFKHNLVSLLASVDLIRITLDSRNKPIYLGLLPKSPEIEERYAETTAATALSGTGLPRDTLCKMGLFFSRRELTHTLAIVNRATFYNSKAALHGPSLT